MAYLYRVLAALSSGLLLYLGQGLHPMAWCLWLAPAPLLVAALSAGFLEAWGLSLLAGLIGQAGMFSYLAGLIGKPGAALVCLLGAVMLGAITLTARGVMRRSDHWLLPFAFPVAAAGFDTLVAAVSPHGSAGSWAYSQMDVLPAVQVAALGGTPAVVFLISLVGGTLAVAIARRQAIRIPLLAYGLPILLRMTALGGGAWRLHRAPVEPNIRVGLVAADTLSMTPARAGEPDDPTLYAYLDAMSRLAGQGARLVVAPEKIETIASGRAAYARAGLQIPAFAMRTPFLIGVTTALPDHLENRAWLIQPTGEAIDYQKRHLVPGLERRFTPGHERKRFVLYDRLMGVAICKDMDFASLGREYAGVGAVLVPAWDFGADGRMHSRMAVLRGVENGYTVIRSARDGLLTVSDRYGRIRAETRSNLGPVTTLIANAPLAPIEPTVYASIGDVFGWFCVLVMALFWIERLVRRRALVEAAETEA